MFPIPPDVLLIALCLGAPLLSFRFAAVCTAGSVLGGLFGYFIGSSFWHAAGPFFFKYVFSPEAFARVQSLYNEYDFVSVFVSGFTPIPYKVFTIAAGVFGLNLVTFTLASLCGRAARFFLVALLIFKFGPPIKVLIDKYFELITVVFTVCLIGGFVLLKVLAH